MDWDLEKIDQAVLGLLYLTLHDGCRAWKGLDRDALNRLHAKGLIECPINKNKSVALTAEGLAAAERIARVLFSVPPGEKWKPLAGRPDIRFRSADGLKGVILQSPLRQRHFFRIYREHGVFEDFDLIHDELSVRIDDEAMAALYRSAEQAWLDHDPNVLGIGRGKPRPRSASPDKAGPECHGGGNSSRRRSGR
ncbi:MAG: DUF6429 family protein [Steroidobacteraceae bacterium]